MKRLYIVLPAVLIAVVAIALGVAQFYAPDMASTLKEEIEMQGSAMTGVPVSVERVELSPVTGEGRLIGLTIGNPPGYRAESALWLGEVEVRIDPRVLRISPVIIRAIDIRQLRVTVEGGLGGNNLSALERNVGAYLKEAAGMTGNGESDAEDSDLEPVADSGSSPRLIVKSINILDGQVVLAPRLLMGATMTNELKDIHLKDVGAEKGGASVGELVGALVNAIMIGVGDTAGQDGDENQG